MPTLQDQIAELQTILATLAAQAETLDRLIEQIAETVLAGHTLFTCGNGGSATDAIHLAEELVGRYRGNRRPLPGICLNTDVGALTCIGNDYGFDQVFARQLEALARPGDILVCFSTSGNSPNILNALHMARSRGVTSIAMLGKDGGPARNIADHAVVVPGSNSARIQEVHTLLLHAICEAIEQRCSL